MKRIVVIILSALLLVGCGKTHHRVTINVLPPEGGTVSARSGIYLDGENLTLNAVPNGDYRFVRWEGDLTGDVNPEVITVDRDLCINAVFSIGVYDLNVKTRGQGKVDKNVVGTKTMFDPGTTVELIATPDRNWKFSHWEGAVNGTEDRVRLDVTHETEVIAVFIMDPTQPSVIQKNLYYGWDFSNATWGHQFLSVDYNADGYPDYISSIINTDRPQRYNLQFYLGDETGRFTPDPKNNDRILGQIWARKFLCGDYNGDGMVDICLLGHGADKDPWPGEYIVILMSTPDGSFEDVRLTDHVSYFHGGASADFDNDGDLDIFAIASWHGEGLFLINDGRGNFTPDYGLFRQDLRQGLYFAEMYDIDGDGFIDLVAGGHDHEGAFEYGEDGEVEYKNMPIVFWGNGRTFNHDDWTRFPQTPVEGFGIVTDFEFFDIDDDGVDEIIISRTGDGKYRRSYRGWCIQVLKRDGRSFKDVTEKLMPIHDAYNESEGWIILLDVDTSGEIPLLTARFNNKAVNMYEIRDGKFCLT